MNQSMRYSQASLNPFGNMPPIQSAREMNSFMPLELEPTKKVSHEMGVGNSDINHKTSSVSTDV
jgi:hypothetical protein